MLRIITCFKWVIDQADIKTAPGSRELVLDRAAYRISDYDRFAIEEAVSLQEQHGGSTVAITVGSPAARKSLKDVLSRGPEKAYFVNDTSFDTLEPSQTASILAMAIRSQLEYDLIICGEGSGDLYAQQVGPRLAEALNISCVTCVSKLTVYGSQLIAERKLEDGIEIVAIPLPALVTVLPEINTPRIPGLKDTLAASKKPVVDIKAADLGQSFEPCLQTVSILASTMERNGVKFGCDGADIRKFVDAILKTGTIN
ncbi:MAG TPA: electron transfer flavoprotein beta subunit/FixA family protein [Syntrophomonas sp.]|nr:electron transfer flavoprotein beta subunit/FixA family protein [Syntrophomonas sp.]